MKESKRLRRSLMIAAVAMLAALFAVSAATFAWYIYQTSGRTTKVEMAAGSSVTLQIASTLDGEYKSSAVMEQFRGRLNPVSTDKISGGFQRAKEFGGAGESGPARLVATLFERSAADAVPEQMDYYKTSLFLRSSANNTDIYLSDIIPDNVRESDPQLPAPIASALRLGLVVKQEGGDGSFPEYIFEVTRKPSVYRETGDNADRHNRDGIALDSSKTDGSIVEVELLNSTHFCTYNQFTGEVDVPDTARKLFTLTKAPGDAFAGPVEVEVYLWLEGCDLDCTQELQTTSLDTLTLSFAGKVTEGR